MKTFLLGTATLFTVILIFTSGWVLGTFRMREFVLVRCMANSSQWYPYPQLCKYFVGDIKGRDE